MCCAGYAQLHRTPCLVPRPIGAGTASHYFSRCGLFTTPESERPISESGKARCFCVGPLLLPSVVPRPCELGPHAFVMTTILSLRPSASVLKGLQPRSSMTPGRNRKAGAVLSLLQLLIVEGFTPSRSAQASLESPKSNILFRKCSPSVFGSHGYVRGGGFGALKVISQNGSAT
jgi:hypothetical protein